MKNEDDLIDVVVEYVRKVSHQVDQAFVDDAVAFKVAVV